MTVDEEAKPRVNYQSVLQIRNINFFSYFNFFNDFYQVFLGEKHDFFLLALYEQLDREYASQLKRGI